MKKFLLLLILSFIISCAPRPKVRSPRVVIPETRSSSASQTEVSSPARTASNALLEEGKASFEAGRYDHAADLFQEALTMDPSNGVAYFQMALVKTQAGEYGEAWNFLEKAETLLASNSQWTEPLQSLRKELSQKKP